LIYKCYGKLLLKHLLGIGKRSTTSVLEQMCKYVLESTLCKRYYFAQRITFREPTSSLEISGHRFRVSTQNSRVVRDLSLYIGASVGPQATDAGLAFMFQKLDKHKRSTTVIGSYAEVNTYFN
jgi:hypothetical protein